MSSPSLVRATVTLLAGGVLAQALPLLLGPWIARLYTPAEFGQFSLVWTLATNVAVVACARYEFALALETDEAEAARLMALCLRLLLAVTAASIAVGGVWMLFQDLPLAGLLPLAVLAGGASQWLSQWLGRAGRFKQLAWARVVQWGGAAVAQVGLGLLQLGAWGLMAGATAAAGLAVLLQLRPAPAGGWRALLRDQPLKDIAARHRDFPLFNTPHAFAGALQDTLTLMLLAAWLGAPAAGLWAMAIRYLKAPASLIGGALSQALYPQLGRDPAGSRALVRRSLLQLLALALPLMAALMAFGPWVFATAFGEAWRPAGELARSLGPYIALHFIASPLSVVPMAWGAQAWALRLALVGQVVFLAGLALGLWLGGLTGAGWGVSAATACYFGYFFWGLLQRAPLNEERP